MKKCPKCGQSSDAKYCGYCGTKLKNGNTHWWLLGIVILVVLLIVAIFFYPSIPHPSSVYTLEVKSNNLVFGTVNKGGKYKVGEKVTLVASANLDTAYFSHWEINGKVENNNERYDYIMPSSNVTIEGVFKVAEPKKSEIHVSSISLNKENLTLKENASAILKVSIQPDSATNKSVEWSSSDVSIATVDENGKVTAIKEGKAKIRVKTMDGSELSAYCDVFVPSPLPHGLDLGYGTYEGDIKNGKANGTGRLVFKTRHAISVFDPDKSRIAEPGDYLDGRFENNHFYTGRWFGANGVKKGAITFQKSGIPSN